MYIICMMNVCTYNSLINFFPFHSLHPFWYPFPILHHLQFAIMLIVISIIHFIVVYIFPLSSLHFVPFIVFCFYYCFDYLVLYVLFLSLSLCIYTVYMSWPDLYVTSYMTHTSDSTNPQMTWHWPNPMLDWLDLTPDLTPNPTSHHHPTPPSNLCISMSLSLTPDLTSPHLTPIHSKNKTHTHTKQSSYTHRWLRRRWERGSVPDLIPRIWPTSGTWRTNWRGRGSGMTSSRGNSRRRERSKKTHSPLRTNVSVRVQITEVEYRRLICSRDTSASWSEI